MNIEEAAVRNFLIPRGSSFEHEFFIRIGGEPLLFSDKTLHAQIRDENGRSGTLTVPDGFTVGHTIRDVLAADGVTVLQANADVITLSLTDEQTLAVTSNVDQYWDFLVVDVDGHKAYYRKGTVRFTGTVTVQP
jgi:hypothetical protein